ncbi:MAG: glycosyltransferase family 4 protein [Paludibacteraceae bacterium]
MFRYSDTLIVLSNQWIKWINQAYPENSFSFKVLYNPCPDVRRDFSKRKNIILYAGLLNDRKGYNRLIEAFSKVAHLHKNWQLVFAGNGEIDNGQRLAIKLNIESQVKFLGWVSGNHKEDIFQQASVYCLPSWGEGFPMGVLDAMAYGIPVVTTPVGGIPDLIEDGVNGFIFDPYDTERLAAKLSELISSSELRNRLSKDADSLVNNEFNINVINQELADIYDKISK